MKEELQQNIYNSRQPFLFTGTGQVHPLQLFFAIKRNRKYLNTYYTLIAQGNSNSSIYNRNNKTYY